jgi:hypothetical protein
MQAENHRELPGSHTANWSNPDRAVFSAARRELAAFVIWKSKQDSMGGMAVAM